MPDVKIVGLLVVPLAQFREILPKSQSTREIPALLRSLQSPSSFCRTTSLFRQCSLIRTGFVGDNCNDGNSEGLDHVIIPQNLVAFARPRGRRLRHQRNSSKPTLWHGKSMVTINKTLFPLEVNCVRRYGGLDACVRARTIRRQGQSVHGNPLGKCNPPLVFM